VGSLSRKPSSLHSFFSCKNQRILHHSLPPLRSLRFCCCHIISTPQEIKGPTPPRTSLLIGCGPLLRSTLQILVRAPFQGVAALAPSFLFYSSLRPPPQFLRLRHSVPEVPLQRSCGFLTKAFALSPFKGFPLQQEGNSLPWASSPPLHEVLPAPIPLFTPKTNNSIPSS